VAENIKAIAPHLLALVVIVGGGILLVVHTQVSPDALLPFVTGMIGSVITWEFGQRQNVQTLEAASRLTSSALAAGSTTNANPNGTPNTP
jgi:hypothetical protein